MHTILVVWFPVSVIIIAASGLWHEIEFIALFGICYGGLVYSRRRSIKSFFFRRKLNVFPVYMAIAIAVSVIEELTVYMLGNRVAVHNIWRDIIIVPGEWSVWFATWYLFLARRFWFTDIQMLLSAGAEGVMFEYIGNGLFLANPLGFLVSIPLAILIYAAIFILPMQLMPITGESRTLWKYPISILLPYALSIPMALFLYAITG